MDYTFILIKYIKKIKKNRQIFNTGLIIIHS